MFTAINPKDTIEVEVEGAKFTIGVIPYQKFLELQSQISMAGDTKTPTNEKVLTLSKGNVDFVRWGVKGHSKMKFKNGVEVPFKTVEVDFDGVKYQVVAEETLQIYFPKTLYVKLADEVISYNMMTESEEKN